jgi:hypothetical protein
MSTGERVERARELARLAAERARASGKLSVFGLTCSANLRNPGLFYSGMRDTAETAGYSAILREARWGAPVAREVDGEVDVILVDVEGKVEGWSETVLEILKGVRRSEVLTYHPNDLTARAADALLAQLGVTVADCPLAVLGAGHVGTRIAQRLVERGHRVRLWRRDLKALESVCEAVNALRSPHAAGEAEPAATATAACSGARVVLGCAAGMAVVSEEIVKGLQDDAILIDVGNGTISPEAIAAAAARGLTMLCLNFRSAYDGEMMMLLRTRDLVEHQIGRRSVGAATLISGGVLGRRGDVIVDNCSRPTQIFGIADGKGDVVIPMEAPEWQSVLGVVREEIRRGGSKKGIP